MGESVCVMGGRELTFDVVGGGGVEVSLVCSQEALSSRRIQEVSSILLEDFTGRFSSRVKEEGSDEPWSFFPPEEVTSKQK
ncbi:hypothetical protein J6590_054825 [Homalodisca vitripennis]|nr:hypothetical protein J6590_054825 [Homalodisca vitripennis]